MIVRVRDSVALIRLPWLAVDAGGADGANKRRERPATAADAAPEFVDRLVAPWPRWIVVFVEKNDAAGRKTRI